MARNQTTQRQRTAKDPLLLGTFEETSIRYLKGKLGGSHQPITGGYGGGTINHWFKIKLNTAAWIITLKAGGWEKWFTVSAYDINRNPIVGRGIFTEDSLETIEDGKVYHPYTGHIMATESELYNQYDPERLDKGDSRYYPLDIGEYLICVSSTLNTPFDYELGIVVEVADTLPVLITENYDRLLLETIGLEDNILLETPDTYRGEDSHDHSLSEWQSAWKRERQTYEKFPTALVALTTKP